MTVRRILVADELSEEGLAILGETGDVTVRTGMSEEELRAELPQYHALVVRSATTVTGRSLELADNLAVIGRAGIGVDNIDVAAATDRGIVVMNTPDAGAVTTSELAVALLMSMARKIASADASVRTGKWEKSKHTGVEISGKTLGVLGLGRIGRHVAERGVGLQMKVLAHDPAVSQGDAPESVRLVGMEELLTESDFLTVHVPLFPETHHLLNDKNLAMMKPTAMLIHAARGGIVDENAMCDALDAGRLAGAALDVFEKEPLDPSSRLRSTPNLLLTPHLGASTKEAKRTVSLDMANQIAACLKTGIVLNGVNVPRIALSEAAMVKPYLMLSYNLGSFLTQIFDGPVLSLRLTLQGGVPESAKRPLTVAMMTGALARTFDRPITPVNVEKLAEDAGIRVHVEASPLKRDFVNLVRVEAVIGSDRHSVSGTVLGHRHGRLVQLDDFLMDAIPEGPALVTFHEDRPGVLGEIGTVLGRHEINISRMQLGNGENHALGIWNLSEPMTDAAYTDVQALSGIEVARAII